MRNEALNEFYIVNGVERRISDSDAFEKIDAPLIYEVNRVIDGVVLFEKGHIERLKDSIELLGYSMQISEDDISKMMKRLIEINKVKNQNIKVVYGDLKKENQKILLYFVKSVYPEKELYESGVKTVLFKSERHNPHAKVVNDTLRESINRKLKEENAREALLVDESGNITEGSRSNFFYIIGEKLYTPRAEKVLLGITRREVIAAALEKGIELVEKPINIDEIEKIDGAFITGTSIDALPISQIDNIDLDTAQNEIMKSIISGYNSRIAEYKAKKKA